MATATREGGIVARCVGGGESIGEVVEIAITGHGHLLDDVARAQMCSNSKVELLLLLKKVLFDGTCNCNTGWSSGHEANRQQRSLRLIGTLCTFQAGDFQTRWVMSIGKHRNLPSPHS